MPRTTTGYTGALLPGREQKREFTNLNTTNHFTGETHTKTTPKHRNLPNRHATLAKLSSQAYQIISPSHLIKEVASIGPAETNRPFFIYDLHLCLQQHNKQALSKWKALTSLLHRLATIDNTTVLYGRAWIMPVSSNPTPV